MHYCASLASRTEARGVSSLIHAYHFFPCSMSRNTTISSIRTPVSLPEPPLQQSMTRQNPRHQILPPPHPRSPQQPSGSHCSNPPHPKETLYASLCCTKQKITKLLDSLANSFLPDIHRTPSSPTPPNQKRSQSTVAMTVPAHMYRQASFTTNLRSRCESITTTHFRFRCESITATRPASLLPL